MEYILDEKPKRPIIIQGFPGFGLVGTITTGFLIDHLNAKPIGRVWCKELSPMIALHGSKIIKPLEIFYDKKHNILILNALTNVTGIEWAIAETMNNIAKELKAKEIISIEGVASIGAPKQDPEAFYYSTISPERFKKIGIKPMNEGVVMGVTAALLSRAETTPFSCIFAETFSNLPDSKAAAKVIKILDNYLGLEVDYRPLIKKAEEFEKKLQDVMSKGNNAAKLKKQKELSYLG
jgi:predicted ATP-grasp superfamily ATP-dependent carboligase